MLASASKRLVLALVPLCSFTAWAQLPGYEGVPVGSLGGVPFPPANVPDRTIACDVTSNPQTVRVEGFAELLGDLQVTCRGTLRINPRNRLVFPVSVVPRPPAVLETFNLSVTLSVPLTSRETASPLLEALLFIDAPKSPTVGGTPSSNDQNPCATPGTGVCSNLVAHDGLFNTGTSTPGPINDGLAGAAAFTETGSPITVFQGSKQNNQTVVFTGIPISNYDTRGNPRLRAAYDQLVLASGGVYNGQEILVPWEKTFTIKNLRGAIPGAAAANGQVFAFLSIQNTSAKLTLNTASAVVGYVQNGLAFRQRNTSDTGSNPTVAFASCVTVNRDLAVDATDADPFAGHFIAQFVEQYQIAFRRRGFGVGSPDQNDPTVNYNTESGFYNTLFPATNGLRQAGIADHGTRLRFIVRNIPANVRVFTSVGAVTGTSTTVGAYGVVADAAGTNPSPISVPVFASASPVWPTSGTPVINGTTLAGAAIPAGAFVPAGSQQGIFLLNTLNNVAAMTWEIYQADPLQNESVNFLVLVAYRAANNPGLGTATIQGTFAPINTTATTAGFAVPIPRFAETGSPQTGFSISPCITNLLFPFITNQSGFDTALAVSNTSLTNPGTGEILGTDVNAGIAPQNGTCSINYFGTTGADGAAPPPATTAVIPAGRTFTMTLSRGTTGPLGNVPAAANFQGYAIVQCNFRYAHGYAYVGRMTPMGQTHGYVALVMDSNSNRTGITSESLGQ